MSNVVENAMVSLFDDMTVETLVIWADLFKIEHDEENWLDDEWTDKENEMYESWLFKLQCRI